MSTAVRSCQARPGPQPVACGLIDRMPITCGRRPAIWRGADHAGHIITAVAVLRRAIVAAIKPQDEVVLQAPGRSHARLDGGRRELLPCVPRTGRGILPQCDHKELKGLSVSLLHQLNGPEIAESRRDRQTAFWRAPDWALGIRWTHGWCLNAYSHVNRRPFLCATLGKHRQLNTAGRASGGGLPCRSASRPPSRHAACVAAAATVRVHNKRRCRVHPTRLTVREGAARQARCPTQQGVCCGLPETIAIRGGGHLHSF